MKTKLTLIAVIAILIASCANMNRLAQENHQLKKDIRTLLYDMEDDGTLERYDGSDNVCRLIDKTYPKIAGRTTRWQ